jgi:hypothetical protein
MPKSCSSAPLSQDLGLSTSEVQTLGTQAELSTFCVGFQGNFTFDMVVVFPSLRFLMFFFLKPIQAPIHSNRARRGNRYHGPKSVELLPWKFD